MSDVDPNSTSSRTYPLAFDANGEPLDVPSHAVAWRVRKLAKKAGRPKVIFDAETGRPMELPLAASFDDFAAHVDEQGRYRIEAVDAQGRFIPGCVAVTELAFGEKDDDEVETNQKPADTQQLMQLVAELVKTNARVMEAMASAFGQVRPTEHQQPQPVIVASPEHASNPMESITAILQMLKGWNDQRPTGGPAVLAQNPQASS